MSQHTRVTKGLLLLAILSGTLLGPLDAAVNVAFPDITEYFGIDIKSIRWVVIVYVSTYASLMLGFGRIGDVYGHKRVFISGLCVCIGGFALCSLATRFDLLLVSRVIQGVGTAMVLSCGPALATHLYDERFRPRILGAYAMCFGLGGALGPALGGVLVDAFGWTAAFWSRIPLAVFALALSLALKLPSPPRSQDHFSALSSISLAATIALFLFAVSQLESAVDHPERYALLVGVTALVFTLSIVRTRRASQSQISLQAFASFNFSWINVANLAVNFAGFATLLFVPYFLVTVSALPISISGLFMAFGAVGMIIGAQAGGRLLRKQRGERLALAAALFVSIGLLAMSRWDAQTTHFGLLLPLLIHGTGIGLFQVAALDVVTGTLPKHNRGVAGSLVLVMRTIGVVLAASVLTLLFSASMHNQVGIPTLATAFRQTFLIAGLGLCVFCVGFAYANVAMAHNITNSGRRRIYVLLPVKIRHQKLDV